MNILKYDNHWPWGNQTAFVYEDGKGYCMIDDCDADNAFIHDLVVYPDSRKQGRATQLISLCEQEAVSLDKKYIHIRVAPDTFMEEWYHRLGYTQQRENYFKDGYIELRKPLIPDPSSLKNCSKSRQI